MATVIDEKIISLDEVVRNDFPILHQQVNAHPLVYLDNAATTQKPQCVIDAISQYYSQYNANVHRGVHALSEKATTAYEQSRETVRQFINAEKREEIVFVRGVTEAINLIASGYGQLCEPGDEIIITGMEHHANIVPWQILLSRLGINIRVVPVLDNGELDLVTYAETLNENTRLVAVVHVSNAIGTINPVKKMIQMAHQQGIPVLVDGAQAAPHMPIDVQDLDCDYYTFSGHKVYGPTGIGVLYGKYDRLENLPVYQSGGEMIAEVTFEKTTFLAPPYRFEAGTPNIAGVIGLSAALNYIQNVGFDRIQQHEQLLLTEATQALSKVPGLRIIGTAHEKAAVISFVLDDVHAHDIGTILDQHGVAVRAGHHCAMPLINRFNVPATARASFAMYNSLTDIERLVEALLEVRRIFA